MGQIIAIGGGGFLSGSEPELDAYVLQQASAISPKIGFIGTASGDDTRFVARFFARFAKLDCTPSVLSLFGRVENLENWFNEQDIIFVGGGNTKSMPGVWAAWNLSPLLHKALKDGKVLAGVSAGAICWFESGITDSLGADYSNLNGLGFLKGSCCPHYSSEPGRAPVFDRLLESGEIPPGIAIDDGAAAHWIEGELIRVVSAKRGHSALSINCSEGKAVKKRIEAVDLTAAD